MINDEDKLVSVIIPNYKRTNELKRSLLSVVNQIYTNLEIIVIDDNSPNFNEIEEIVLNIKDSRVELVKHDFNKGGGAARNTGILRSKGDYLAFLDSDDEWLSNKIFLQVEESLKNNNALVYCKSEIYRNDGVFIEPYRGIFTNELASEYLFNFNGLIQTSSLFLKTEHAKRCLFDESLPRHQDYDFIFKLERLGIKFLMLDRVLTRVYWDSGVGFHKKGWSPNVSLKLLNDNITSFNKSSKFHFLFKNVISYSASNGFKLKSLKFLFENISCIFYVTFKDIILYFIRLLFDWRIYLK